MKTTFAKTLTELALKDKRIVLLTGDFCFGMFNQLKAERPLQYINCGVAEQSMVGIAAGMAIAGMRPVVYTITPFLVRRAYEQIVLDVDEQNLPVVLVGFDDYPKDGPTHRCLVKLLKNTYWTQPTNGEDASYCLKDALARAKPSFIRLRNEPKPVARQWPKDGYEA